MRKSLYELLREYEFNKTEPETLSELVSKAIERGKDMKYDSGLYVKKSAKLYEEMKNKEVLKVISHNDVSSELTKVESFAVDGSFQIVGGIGGKWYIPVSCATIHFPNGITSTPIVNVAANIELLEEREPEAVNSQAERIMLTIETAGIKACSSSQTNTQSVVFLDGPIIDPPFESDAKYVQTRCEAIVQCLSRGSTVIGVVKRIIGQIFIEHFSAFELASVSNILQDMYSDFNLACHIFAHFAKDRGNQLVYTKPINMNELKNNAAAKTYQDFGIEVYTMLLQNDHLAKPVRVDIPILSNSDSDITKLAYRTAQLVKEWSLPHGSLPLPIILAHDKSNVRKGCAETLYNEIINRSSGESPIENLIRAKLTMDVHE